MNCIEKPMVFELIEKKSKFIGFSSCIKSENDAKIFIKFICDKHKNATHNVFAYKVLNDGILKIKFYDDGEPQHSAGKPIYEILNHMDLVNVIVVVARYFGGIKLGVGGLTRAYSATAKNVLMNSCIIPLVEKKRVIFEFEYSSLSEIDYLLKSLDNLIIINKNYGEIVEYRISTTSCNIERLSSRRDILIKFIET